MTRVLVTGGNGFLGRYVVESLRATGREVWVLARGPSRNVRIIEHDLASGAPSFKSPFDEIYHLAGLAHFRPRSTADREAFFQVNVVGTSNLLEGVERTGQLPGSLVLASTVAVYGVKSGDLLDEQTDRDAKLPYGASKKEAEDRVLEWGERQGVRVAVARLPLLAGCDPPGNLGAMIRALRLGYYFGVGDGSARRSLVLAEDVAAVFPELAQKGGTYNLSDGHHPSMLELEQALSIALARRPARRLPMAVAKPIGWLGDLANVFVSAPFTSGVVGQLTTTLTFSDQRARQNLDWNPRRVVNAATELVEPKSGSGRELA